MQASGFGEIDTTKAAGWKIAGVQPSGRLLCSNNGSSVSYTQMIASDACLLQVDGEVTYNDFPFDDFSVQRTAAYIDQAG